MNRIGSIHLILLDGFLLECKSCIRRVFLYRDVRVQYVDQLLEQSRQH
jgi:hypothetical protein